MRELLSQVRTDLAVLFAMLSTALAHPREVIGLVCDLLGVP